MILLIDAAFILLCIVFMGVAAISVENNWHGTLAILLLCVLGYFLLSVGFMPMINWLSANLSLVIGSVFLYIITGIGWSFFKWDRYCADLAKYSNRRTAKPEWFNNKVKLITWSVYWPFSVVNYAFGRLINDMYEWFINRLGNIYSKIADRHFPVKDIEKDLT